MKGNAMRRFQPLWGGLRAAPNLFIVTLVAAASAAAGVAQAAQPVEAELAMAERPAPPGEGWSLVSTSIAAASVPASKPEVAAPKTPTGNAANADGWQSLAGNSPAPIVAQGATVDITVSPSAPPAPPAEPFVLVGGKSLQAQILEWGKRAGWAVDWRTPDDWIVPNDKAFGPDFEVAVNDVFDQANVNGADVRVDVWEGNRSIVVDKTGAEQ